MAEEASTNASLIGRFLDEISWEGNRVRLYRRGGLGTENLLTTDVLSPLSYLPRQHFLGEYCGQRTGSKRRCRPQPARSGTQSGTSWPYSWRSTRR